MQTGEADSLTVAAWIDPALALGVRMGRGVWGFRNPVAALRLPPATIGQAFSLHPLVAVPLTDCPRAYAARLGLTRRLRSGLG